MSKVFKAAKKVFSGGLIGALLGGAPKAPKVQAPPPPPPVEAPTPIPLENSAEVAAAKRKARAVQQARGGRTSTILSNDDSLGG